MYYDKTQYAIVKRAAELLRTPVETLLAIARKSGVFSDKEHEPFSVASLQAERYMKATHESSKKFYTGPRYVVRGEQSTSNWKVNMVHSSYNKALRVASACATNKRNIDTGNSFIIYKAIKLVQPIIRPIRDCKVTDLS